MFGYFKCSNENKYLINEQICNEIIDCLDGTDEMFCEASKKTIQNCEQVNLMLVCNTKQTVLVDKSVNLKVNDKSIIFISSDGNVELNFLNHSIFVTVLKITNNTRYISQFNLIMFPNLFYLQIRNCLLDNKFLFLNQTKKKLQHLDLALTNLNSLKFLKNLNCKNLIYLDISSTKINYISNSELLFVPLLKKLLMNNCSFIKLEKNTFNSLLFLENLIMMRTKFDYEIEDLEIYNLKRIKKVKSEIFKICCLFLRYHKLGENFYCYPSSSSFRSCSSLISTNLKKVFYWLIGILGCIGNLVLAIYVSSNFKCSKIFHLQLNFADFIISSYILSIAFADLCFKNDFLENDLKWRKSVLCQILGTKATFGTLFSSLSTLFITIQRFLAVNDPMKQHNFYIYHKYILIINFFFCLLLSTLPFLKRNVSFH